MKVRRTSDVRVQVDRWPLGATSEGPHVASVVLMVAFTGKPSAKDIAAALRDGATILETRET